MASERPTTTPSELTPRYLPYPDFRASLPQQEQPQTPLMIRTAQESWTNGQRSWFVFQRWPWVWQLDGGKLFWGVGAFVLWQIWTQRFAFKHFTLPESCLVVTAVSFRRWRRSPQAHRNNHSDNYSVMTNHVQLLKNVHNLLVLYVSGKSPSASHSWLIIQTLRLGSTAGSTAMRHLGENKAVLLHSNDLFHTRIPASGVHKTNLPERPDFNTITLLLKYKRVRRTWWVVDKTSIKYLKKNQGLSIDCLFPMTKHLWYMSILNLDCVEKSCSWTQTLTDVHTNAHISLFSLLKTAASVATVRKKTHSAGRNL